MKKIKKKKFLLLILVVVCIGFIPFAIYGYIRISTARQIVTADDAASLDADCILTLGAQVRGSTLSHMLEDRVLTAVSLYDAKVAPKLLMSGDNGSQNYDEVNPMRKYALNEGVAAADIFMDHAGFSTYESLYRAKNIFGAEKVIIVTQKFHLPRALYIADKLGLEAVGVVADRRPYATIYKSEFREFFACNKAVLDCMFKVKPTYLGEKISLLGDGSITLD